MKDNSKSNEAAVDWIITPDRYDELTKRLVAGLTPECNDETQQALGTGSAARPAGTQTYPTDCHRCRQTDHTLKLVLGAIKACGRDVEATLLKLDAARRLQESTARGVQLHHERDEHPSSISQANEVPQHLTENTRFQPMMDSPSGALPYHLNDTPRPRWILPGSSWSPLAGSSYPIQMDGLGTGLGTWSWSRLVPYLHTRDHQAGISSPSNSFQE